jgi:hypothetical protein
VVADFRESRRERHHFRRVACSLLNLRLATVAAGAALLIPPPAGHASDLSELPFQSSDVSAVDGYVQPDGDCVLTGELAAGPDTPVVAVESLAYDAAECEAVVETGVVDMTAAEAAHFTSTDIQELQSQRDIPLAATGLKRRTPSLPVLEAEARCVATQTPSAGP